MELANKTVIVTGASSGTGAASPHDCSHLRVQTSWPRDGLMSADQSPRTSPEAAAPCIVQPPRDPFAPKVGRRLQK